MTAKELYEWAVAHEAENLDILVNGYAIDFTEPIIDPEIDAIYIDNSIYARSEERNRLNK